MTNLQFGNEVDKTVELASEEQKLQNKVEKPQSMNNNTKKFIMEKENQNKLQWELFKEVMTEIFKTMILPGILSIIFLFLFYLIF